MTIQYDKEFFQLGVDAASVEYRFCRNRYNLILIINERVTILDSLKGSNDIKTISYHRGFIWYLKKKMAIDDRNR